ncbi:hypothetical protein ISN44_As11g021920 [Arabidopsis suecica]|uniref:Uncharacterized protein n=1 Tax=Arabidopsis suecica TaxID=45249 RepID=A0A8T1ZDJ5_ARASU|nr:hypothetical protein ISN44_As11g021920 [Arabidopsis suecica]
MKREAEASEATAGRRRTLTKAGEPGTALKKVSQFKLQHTKSTRTERTEASSERGQAVLKANSRLREARDSGRHEPKRGG